MSEEIEERVAKLEKTVSDTEIANQEMLIRIEALEKTVSDIQLTIQTFIIAAINATKEAKELSHKLKEINTE